MVANWIDRTSVANDILGNTIKMWSTNILPKMKWINAAPISKMSRIRNWATNMARYRQSHTESEFTNWHTCRWRIEWAPKLLILIGYTRIWRAANHRYMNRVSIKLFFIFILVSSHWIYIKKSWRFRVQAVNKINWNSIAFPFINIYFYFPNELINFRHSIHLPSACGFCYSSSDP